MRVFTKFSRYFSTFELFFRQNSHPVTVRDFFKEEIEQCALHRRYSTVRNYRATINSFTAFLASVQDPETGRPLNDMAMSDLNSTIISDYEKWLLTKGLHRNSTSFYMRNFRCVYNKAVKNGFVEQKNPFTSVYTSIDKTRKRALNEDVIVRLLHLDLSHAPALALSRDLFVFSFYARGMTYVDLAYLRKSDIQRDAIIYVRRKTKQQLTVRLEPCMRDIINRYKLTTKGLPYVFPIIKTVDSVEAYIQYSHSLNRHNERLKRLTEMINEGSIITSYTARHTWATTARRHKIPISIISASMGHTTEKTTQIYLAPFENSDIDEANKSILDVVRL